MSQIESQRTPTMVELDAYNKVLALSTYSMEACKPKQKKDKNGIVHNNNHHVPMRYAEIGKYICLQVIQIGSFVLEANDYYVGKNLNEEDRIRNYDMRNKLQNEAIAKTYQVEHCIRILHDHHPFAESTITWWIHLLVDARKSIIAWKDSDAKERRKLKK